MKKTMIAKKNKFKSSFLSGFLLAAIFAVIISLSLLGAANVYGVSNEWSGGKAADFNGGDGTETNPFLISTGEELAYFAAQVNGGVSYAGQYIELTQDILLNKMNANGTFVSGSPRAFTSIGSAAKPFQGIFEANGFEIIGLYINAVSVEYRGLFGYAGTGSQIKNVKISGSIAGGGKSGAVAGYTNGLITGCEVNCPVTANWNTYHGGVAGYAGADSVISNCTVLSSVEGSAYTGGIAGYTKGQIIECQASGTVTGRENTGGIVGQAEGIDSVISNCTVLSSVKGSENVGGIVGYTQGKVTACESSSTLTGQNRVGGIAGYAAGTGSEINNCKFTGTVKDVNGSYTGGIAGQVEGTITGCTVDGIIKSKNGCVGGIAGYAAGAASVITDCSVSGTVEATAGYGYVGGVAGQADGLITYCSTECSVIGTAQHYVGGIVGSASTGSEVNNSSSAGDITGTGMVGGIAGYTDGDIKICINSGNVNGGGNGHTGGIAGETGNNSIVSNSFNGGAVSGGGPGNIGGIVGHAGSGTIVHHNLNQGTVGGNTPTGSIIGNSIDNDNVWQNYYYDDYPGAPGGSNGGDIEDDDGAVPIGDLTWEEICDLLNEDNEDGDNIWNQDMNDGGVPKPGEEGEGGDPDSALKITRAVIKEGKHYTAARLGLAATAAVTGDSVFTTAFSLKYGAGCQPAEQTLQLINNNETASLPAGTSIVMLAEGSYYYVNLTMPVTTLTLGDFIKMGSLVEGYSPAQAAKDEEKEYLFIFDFTQTATGMAGGAYDIELALPDGSYTGQLPVVAVGSKNAYGHNVSAAANGFTVDFGVTTAAGYDYKTDGKVFAYEFYLEREGVIVPLPVGTCVNGSFVSALHPYAFLPLDPGQTTTTVSLDMSECAEPLASGNYTIKGKVYACTDVLNPRGGYMLAGKSAGIGLTGPAVYAIKARVENRLYDQSADSIPVSFTIETLGPGNVKGTLQQKYGQGYVDVAGQADQPIIITGKKATLHLPAGAAKGTYRFVLTLYDDGAAKAGSVENIIIK